MARRDQRQQQPLFLIEIMVRSEVHVPWLSVNCRYQIKEVPGVIHQARNREPGLRGEPFLPGESL
ncbi:MAG: hypothetical protein DSY43_00880 [Gammaproteobacteria bacterium]|nr:MAG: hypothetical protein DSY43_00880 [Gammaproteobacteria bacterium]